MWVNWVQLLLIGAAAPFFLFPSMTNVWVFLVIPIVLVFRKIFKKPFLERTLLDWAIFILLIQVLFTCLFVPDLSHSLPKIAGILFGVALFYSLVAFFSTDKFIKWGIIAFLGTGFFLSVVCILGIEWDMSDLHSIKIIPQIVKKIIIQIIQIVPKIKWNLPGAEEGFNPNAIGGVLVLIFPLSLVLLFSYSKKNRVNFLSVSKQILIIFILLSFLAMVGVLFATLSIGTWLGLVLSLWILLLPWKWKKWSLVLALVIIIFIPIINYDTFKSTKGSIKNDLRNREPLWALGTRTISEHPLFGIGLNHIRLIPFVGKRAHVHNHLLHIGAELGIPGLISYLAILIGTGFMCCEVWRNSNDGWKRLTIVGLACGQLAHFFFGMGDSIPLGAKPGIVFWFSLALIAAMYSFNIKDLKSKEDR